MKSLISTTNVRYRLIPGTSSTSPWGRPNYTASSSVEPSQRAEWIAKHSERYNIPLEMAADEIRFAPDNGHSYDDATYGSMMKQIRSETRSAVTELAEKTGQKVNFEGWDKVVKARTAVLMAKHSGVIGGPTGLSLGDALKSLEAANTEWLQNRS